jgi:quercetin dioxygenase-like cupin family protein
MAIVDMAPGSILPEHKHIHEQIGYVLEGELEVTVGGKVENVKKAGLFGVKTNTTHSYRALNKPARIIVASSPVLRDYVFTTE